MVIRPHCHATFCPHPDNMQISPLYKVTWKRFLINFILDSDEFKSQIIRKDNLIHNVT